MTLEELALWLKQRKLDLHWSWTPSGEACLTAIREKRVWNGTAARVHDAIELLKAAIEASW